MSFASRARCKTSQLDDRVLSIPPLQYASAVHGRSPSTWLRATRVVRVRGAKWCRAPRRRSQAGRQSRGLAQTAPSRKARAFGRDGLCASVNVEIFEVTLYRTYPVLTDSRSGSWSSRRTRCGYPVSRTGHQSAHGTRSCTASHLGGIRQAPHTHFSNDHDGRSREREGEAVNLERLRRSGRLQC